MESIHVDQTLRPSRYCFAVPSNDASALRRAVSLCTVLWGGIYNPIVRVEPLEHALGIVDEFDPDKLVDLSGGKLPAELAARFPERVIGAEKIIGEHWTTKRKSLGFGFSILPVLGDIHDREFRFAREGSSNVRVFSCAEGDPWKTWLAVVAGSFADLPALDVDFRGSCVRLLQAEELGSPEETDKIVR